MICMCMINRMLSQNNIKGQSPEKRLSQHERTNHKGQKSPLLEILQTKVHTTVILEKPIRSIAPCIFFKTKKNKKHITITIIYQDLQLCHCMKGQNHKGSQSPHFEILPTKAIMVYRVGTLSIAPCVF